MTAPRSNVGHGTTLAPDPAAREALRPFADAFLEPLRMVEDASDEVLTLLDDKAAEFTSTNCGWHEYAAMSAIGSAVRAEIVRRKTEMRSGYAATMARAADMVAADHLPACPSCGDLCAPEATVCECGERLTPRPHELPVRHGRGDCACMIAVESEGSRL